LLAASEQGQDVNEFREFLLARSSDSLPEAVEQLLKDCIKRATLLQDKGKGKGKVSLIECADASLAESFTNDSISLTETHFMVPEVQRRKASPFNATCVVPCPDAVSKTYLTTPGLSAQSRLL